MAAKLKLNKWKHVVISKLSLHDGYNKINEESSFTTSETEANTTKKPKTKNEKMKKKKKSFARGVSRKISQVLLINPQKTKAAREDSLVFRQIASEQRYAKRRDGLAESELEKDFQTIKEKTYIAMLKEYNLI